MARDEEKYKILSDECVDETYTINYKTSERLFEDIEKRIDFLNENFIYLILSFEFERINNQTTLYAGLFVKLDRETISFRPMKKHTRLIEILNSEIDITYYLHYKLLNPFFQLSGKHDEEKFYKSLM